jgi:hypothetical protein
LDKSAIENNQPEKTTCDKEEIKRELMKREPIKYASDDENIFRMDLVSYPPPNARVKSLSVGDNSRFILNPQAELRKEEAAKKEKELDKKKDSTVLSRKKLSLGSMNRLSSSSSDVPISFQKQQSRPPSTSSRPPSGNASPLSGTASPLSGNASPLSSNGSPLPPTFILSQPTPHQSQSSNQNAEDQQISDQVRSQYRKRRQ